MCFTIFVQKHGRMYIAKATNDLNTKWHFTNAVFCKMGKPQPPNEYFWSDLNEYSTLSQCNTLISMHTTTESHWHFALTSPFWAAASTLYNHRTWGCWILCLNNTAPDRTNISRTEKNKDLTAMTDIVCQNIYCLLGEVQLARAL